MTVEALPALLDRALEIAREAGERILEVYAADFDVVQKADNSPLTQADLASHRHIVDSLRQLTPDLPVLSEEGAALPYATRATWRRYWLVDPLDGTKEFVQRNGEFTVNIALIEDGTPILGVVHAPALELTYGAAQGLGAFQVVDGRRVALRTRPTPERPTLVISRSHADAALDRLLEQVPPHDAISRGSSLKFCLVAAAEADLYPRTGPTSEWDTAAGQCVAEQAGARVLRLPELEPLAYNQKESLLNPGFVVIGDPAFGWETRLREALAIA